MLLNLIAQDLAAGAVWLCSIRTAISPHADGPRRHRRLNLSKGGLGERTSHLLSALLITGFAQAALSRADSPEAERRVFHLYADEFQSFATESFALILSEAPKHALTLTMAHQYLDQLPDHLQAVVFGNVGTIVTLRTSATDSPLVSEQIGIENAGALLDLANGEAWARLLYRGGPTSPLRLGLFPAPRPRRSSVRRLVETSAAPFGRPRAAVEGRITKFLQG